MKKAGLSGQPDIQCIPSCVHGPFCSRVVSYKISGSKNPRDVPVADVSAGYRPISYRKNPGVVDPD
jgi:hypothetical protein